MSRESQPDLPNVHEHEFTAPNAPEGPTPEAGVSRAVARLRQASKKDILRSKPEYV